MGIHEEKKILRSLETLLRKDLLLNKSSQFNYLRIFYFLMVVAL
jgi:hypothetical protein